MEIGKIRYHPLIDADTSGAEKVSLFPTGRLSIVRKNHTLFLSEMIPDYYRLHANEPMTERVTDNLSIHCPKCGTALTQIAKNLDTDRLGLYTCKRCNQ